MAREEVKEWKKGLEISREYDLGELSRELDLRERMNDVRVFKKIDEEKSGILRNDQDLRPVLIQISLQDDPGVLLDNLINASINLPIHKRRLKKNVGID